MRLRQTSLIALAIGACLLAPNLATAEETLKIGVLATLEGPFTILGQEGLRGVQVAVDEIGGSVAGKKIEIIKQATDASPDSAVRAARTLVEQKGVKLVIGPLSGDEGLAVKDYAKTKPDVTFVNGASASQDFTLRNPAENIFRFSTDGAQWNAGLGTYVYQVKGYKKVAIVAEDYSFPYTQVFGFMAEFCKAGGSVASKSWVPIGNKDFSSVIAAIPDGVDAIYVALGGSDAVNFLSQYQQAGGAAPLIGGSITVDQNVLQSKGKAREVLIGTASSGPVADLDTPEWKAFATAYKKQPDAFPSPSIFAQSYYVDAKPLLMALQQTGADISDGGKKLREVLSKISYELPTGKISLDKNRNAIADEFITEVAAAPDGTLYKKLVKVVSQTTQTLGFSEAEFIAMGPVGRDKPPCGK